MPWIYSQDFHGFSFHLHKIFQISFTRNSSSLLCDQTKLWRVLDLSQACLALILAQFPRKAPRNPHESLANFLHLVKFPVVFLCLCKNLFNTFRKSLPTTFWPRKKVSNLAGRTGEYGPQNCPIAAHVIRDITCLVYTHSVILVIQAIWLVSYLGLWRYIHRARRWI